MQSDDKINNKLPPVTERDGVNRVVVFNVNQKEDRFCETTALLCETKRVASMSSTQMILSSHYAKFHSLFIGVIVVQTFLFVKHCFCCVNSYKLQRCQE